MKGRILLAKPGLDGHEAGVMLVARALRDAGFEVIYLGLRQTARAIARTAIVEDVDSVGLSVLTGGHVNHARQLLHELRVVGAGDIAVVVGGIISPQSAEEMRVDGVRASFGPGDSLRSIVATFEEICAARSAT